jgi:hypothetical protein
MDDVSTDDRLAELERRVARLEGLAEPGPGAEPVPVGAFWALAGLTERAAGLEQGAVVYAGHVDIGDGPVDWQITTAAGDLAGQEWADLAEPLGALGHPVRLRLLQAIATGTHTTAQLQELPGLGTTGQIYHHLRALTSAGWLRAGGRGSWAVPPERVVPLLVVLAAARR